MAESRSLHEVCLPRPLGRSTRSAPPCAPGEHRDGSPASNDESSPEPSELDRSNVRSGDGSFSGERGRACSPPPAKRIRLTSTRPRGRCALLRSDTCCFRLDTATWRPARRTPCEDAFPGLNSIGATSWPPQPSTGIPPWQPPPQAYPWCSLKCAYEPTSSALLKVPMQLQSWHLETSNWTLSTGISSYESRKLSTCLQTRAFPVII